MLKNVMSVIFKIVITMIIIQVIYLPISNAAGPLTDILNTGQNFIGQGKNETEKNATIDVVKLKDTTDMIYYILIPSGVVIAVIVGAILGIQIMWGSIEQKTKAKEALMPYALGCIVVFGAFGIWKLCVTIFAQL